MDSEAYANSGAPLFQRSGLETVRVVREKLLEVVAEFLASPDRHQWPDALTMGSALLIEDTLTEVAEDLQELADLMELDEAGGEDDERVSVDDLPDEIKDILAQMKRPGQGGRYDGRADQAREYHDRHDYE
jgi:hypothetical protein